MSKIIDLKNYREKKEDREANGWICLQDPLTKDTFVCPLQMFINFLNGVVDIDSIEKNNGVFRAIIADWLSIFSFQEDGK